MFAFIKNLFKPKRSPLEQKAWDRFMNYNYKYVELNDGKTQEK